LNIVGEQVVIKLEVLKKKTGYAFRPGFNNVVVVNVRYFESTVYVGTVSKVINFTRKDTNKWVMQSESGC
jgi:hypothetical protein